MCRGVHASLVALLGLHFLMVSKILLFVNQPFYQLCVFILTCIVKRVPSMGAKGVEVQLRELDIYRVLEEGKTAVVFY